MMRTTCAVMYFSLKKQNETCLQSIGNHKMAAVN